MGNINQETTLAQLIELGIIKTSQIDTWNKRLARGAEKRADSLSQARCNTKDCNLLQLLSHTGNQLTGRRRLARHPESGPNNTSRNWRQPYMPTTGSLS